MVFKKRPKSLCISKSLTALSTDAWKGERTLERRQSVRDCRGGRTVDTQHMGANVCKAKGEMCIENIMMRSQFLEQYLSPSTIAFAKLGKQNFC